MTSISFSNINKHTTEYEDSGNKKITRNMDKDPVQNSGKGLVGSVWSLARRSRVIVEQLASRVTMGIGPDPGDATPTMNHVERLALQEHHGAEGDWDYVTEPNAHNRHTGHNRTPKPEPPIPIVADHLNKLSAGILQTKEPTNMAQHIAEKSPPGMNVSSRKSRDTPKKTTAATGNNTNSRSVVSTPSKVLNRAPTPDNKTPETLSQNNINKISTNIPNEEHRATVPAEFNENVNNNAGGGRKHFGLANNDSEHSVTDNSNNSNATKEVPKSTIPLLNIKTSTLTSTIQKSRRRLFCMPSNNDKVTDEVKPTTAPPDSSADDNSSVNLNLSDSSTSSEDSYTDSENTLEFKRDLNFLSKCGNMMSSPDKGPQQGSPTTPKSRPNRALCDEQSSSQRARSGCDLFDISLPPPDSITKALYSSLGHGLVNLRQRSPVALSPLAVSKHRPDIDIQDRVTRIVQQQRSPTDVCHNLYADLNNSNCLDEDDSYLITRLNTSSKFNLSNDWQQPFGPVFSTPVRRCLVPAQFSPPLLSTTAAEEDTGYQLLGSRNDSSSSSAGKTPWKQFRNEDEEAVYYLITKYLQKEDNVAKDGV